MGRLHPAVGMRDDPGLDTARIAASLQAGYGLDVAAIRYLPIGYDLDAAVYEVVVADGERYFLKVRFGPVSEPGLEVARALAEFGIGQVLAPILSTAGAAVVAHTGHPRAYRRALPVHPGREREGNRPDRGPVARIWGDAASDS